MLAVMVTELDETGNTLLGVWGPFMNQLAVEAWVKTDESGLPSLDAQELGKLGLEVHVIPMNVELQQLHPRVFIAMG